jgi:hypothetical protein
MANVTTIISLQSSLPEVTKSRNCKTIIRGAAGEFYDSGIKKMVHRMQKCIDLNGDYVEK